jgi:hypothetical protein
MSPLVTFRVRILKLSFNLKNLCVLFFKQCGFVIFLDTINSYNITIVIVVLVQRIRNR